MVPDPYENKDMSNFVQDPFQARRDYLCQSVVDFSLRDTKTLEKFVHMKFDNTELIDSLITELSDDQANS